MKLYKYYPISDQKKRKDWIYDLIVNQKLYLSSYDKLNDPFEFSFGKMPISGNNVERTLEDALYDKIEGHGIFCLSGSSASPLMWSHYTQAFNGICIELDCDKDSRLKKIEQVNYIPTSDLDQSNLENMDYRLTKSNDWEYEDEYRLIIPSYANKSINIEPKVITKVCIGRRVSITDIEWLKDTIEKSDSDIKDFQCYADPKTKLLTWKSGFPTKESLNKRTALEKIARGEGKLSLATLS